MKDPLTPHMFRHTFAYAAAKELDVISLAKILGHSDLKSTSVYVTPNLSEVADQLSGMYQKTLYKSLKNFDLEEQY